MMLLIAMLAICMASTTVESRQGARIALARYNGPILTAVVLAWAAVLI
jgi:hypothetical protein